jgi:hypothetical protein
MSHTMQLPARSYEEALPYLRAPYQPNQIRALILNAPDNPMAPCGIALYAIGETAMDRFNLICASNWSRTFETMVETERKVGEKTYYYCEVRAIVVAFGDEHDDIGEAEAETRGSALMNARAQAWKRGARWHGPGQCLYAAEQILLWRSDKDDELFIPKSGDNPSKHPYMKQGGQQRCRAEYQKWLGKDGEAIFGKPLDHLALYREIARRAAGIPTAGERPALPPAPVQTQRRNASGPRPAAGEQNPEVASDDVEAARLEDVEQGSGMGEQEAAPESSATAGEVAPSPMPDLPPADATVTIAESIGYTADVARGVSNLARTDGQTTGLSERQQTTVLNWLVLLSDLKIASETVLDAIEHVAVKGTNQERRQATFTRWLAAKTSGGGAAPAATGDPADTEQPSGETAPGAEAPQAGADPRVEDDALQSERALVRIHRAMASNGYSDRSVTQLTALAVGVGPTGKVDWDKVPADTLQVLAELLESAGLLGWTPDTFAKKVLEAHNSTQQGTIAGRFSALAGYLTDLVESRSVEAA